MVGCSYSGLRAAVSRSRCPGTFFATYAASAPVQLQVNLDTFFDSIYHKLIDEQYTNCTRDLHTIMLHIDDQLSHTETASAIKQSLLGAGAEENGNGDFALAIANIYSYFQSYGIDGGAHSLASLCDYLEAPSTQKQALRGTGLTIDHAASTLIERLASWPGLVKIVNDHFNTSCRVADAGVRAECELGKTASDSGGISWTWQLCSELGLFATQKPSLQSLVSRYMSLEYRKSLCVRQFPDAYSSGRLPDLPPVKKINQRTGGQAMQPSNVFWTAGEYDPWRELSPLAATSGSVRENLFSISQIPPGCNVSTSNDTVFGYVLQDAQHCLDWTMGSHEAGIARDHFARALREWLPCFRVEEFET